MVIGDETNAPASPDPERRRVQVVICVIFLLFNLIPKRRVV